MAKDPKKTIEELNEELSHFEDQVISVAELLSQRVKNAIEDIRDESAAVADIFEKKLKKSIKDIAKESDTTLKNTLKLMEGSAKLEDIEKARLQLDLKKSAAERNMLNNAKYMLEATGDQVKVDQFILDTQMELDDIYKQQTIHLDDQEVLAKKIQKNMGATGAIMQGMVKIPILGNLINSQRVLAKIQQEAAKENATKMSVFKAGVKGVGSSLASNFSGPAAGFSILAKVLQFIIDAMLSISKRVNDIGKNLSIGKTAASGIYENIARLTPELTTSLKNVENVAEAFNDIAQLTGFSTIATMKQIDAQIKLTKELGLSKDEALGMQEVFVTNNIEANKGIEATYDQIAAFANQNKIVADGKQIFSEISKTSKLIQLNFRGNYKELVNTVLETKKLGLTLEQVSKVGKSLLNFEQSIAAEIEAEVVTGKELNLEEARRYALNHDLAGLTREIAKNIGSAEEFSAMNAIQQESVANAVGMSAEELADVLYKQQVIQETAGNYTNELREHAKLLRSERNFEKAIAVEKEAEAIEKGILEGKSLDSAKAALDAQTKFENSLERVKGVFQRMIDEGLIDRLAEAVENIVTGIEKVTKLNPKKEAAKFALKKAGPLGAIGVKIYEYFDKDENNTETATEAKGVQGSEKNSLGKSNSLKSDPMTEMVDDVLIRPGQKPMKFNKDDIHIAGTDLFGGEGGNNSEMLSIFREIRDSINKGGNIYLDREKVGTSFAVGTREL